MEKQYTRVLTKCKPDLVGTITDIGGLLDRLESRETLNSELVMTIKAERKLTDKIRVLLEILPRRSQKAFDDFYISLQEIKETAAVTSIKNQLKKAGLPIPEQDATNRNEGERDRAEAQVEDKRVYVRETPPASDLETDAAPYSISGPAYTGSKNTAMPEPCEASATPEKSLVARREEPSLVCHVPQRPIQETVGLKCVPPSVTEYDVAILCHPTCRDQAKTLSETLMTMHCEAHSPLKVTLADEYAKAGATEIANLDHLIKNIPCILLMIEEEFFTNRQCMFEANVSMTSSLTNELVANYVKADFVIPVFMKPPRQIRGATPSITAMTGIHYYNGDWNDSVEEAFRRNIERCLNK
ncbi:uncharacterized protein LOC121382052 isoform X2 [Gigantopelta aegis]|nr:uncharacterized protein LOC121382052 isoform X2 [Gigantopelta aegis]XP_041367463.1 uncharacterized protein LOC121382052 isoform X2 [Gigantopelta aegis]